jgi:hypothetical protein
MIQHKNRGQSKSMQKQGAVSKKGVRKKGKKKGSKKGSGTFFLDLEPKPFAAPGFLLVGRQP